MTHFVIELICLALWATGFALSFRAVRRDFVLERHWVFFLKMNVYLWPITIIVNALRWRLELIF
jgi:hypothetical protein